MTKTFKTDFINIDIHNQLLHFLIRGSLNLGGIILLKIQNFSRNKNSHESSKLEIVNGGLRGGGGGELGDLGVT